MDSHRSLTSPDFKKKLEQCVHCGLCLTACPTYGLFHTEMDSPRGRISLMQAAADGRIELDGAFREHIDLCLGCRACEPACPSGVQYGFLLEGAREAIQADHSAQNKTGMLERLSRRLALHQVLPYPGRLRLLARILRLYQKLGFDRLTRRLEFLPAALHTMDSLLPTLSLDFPDYSQPALAFGTKRGTVAFLHGCVQDAFLAGVNAATVRVLQHNGYEVHFPKQQTCCGAAPLHIGERQLAQEMARQNLDAFEDDYDAIINNAGGCGATLKEYAHLLSDDPAYASKAARFAAKTQDISEFLVANLNTPPAGAINSYATYVDSCHLRHGQRIVEQPRTLLQSIPGLTLIELSQPDMCCGSAGVYNILQAETASQVLDAKMADIQATGAQIIVTTNTGCHMQLLKGVREANIDIEVVHLVQLLDRSYRIGESA